MAMLETPSRIWRRIEAIEGKDMPSLPSLPAFDDSAESELSDDSPEDNNFSDISSPIHSTPAALLSHTPSTNSTPHHSRSIPLSAASSLPGVTTPSQQTEIEEEDPVTPHTRRRSFLLSVINSAARPRLLSRWQTPAPSSDDNAGDRASFISTASSHDLTTHHRVNTSFDPAIGAQGHGLGRFNAGKLNSYLHGLNRRLQEENEGLVERLKKVEEERPVTATGRWLGGPGRRISIGGTALGDVEEDVGGEGWVEEKAELEDMVNAFQEEVQRCIEDKERLEQALEKEREERKRDKEKWKERMGEVEKGVEGIVKELEEKLLEAERRATELGNSRVDDLHRDLSDLADELQRTEAEKDRIAAEKSDVVRTVIVLEAELQRARGDAEALGRDLNFLRAEKDELVTKRKEEWSDTERMQNQHQIQMQMLNEQLESQQRTATQTLEGLKNHVCERELGPENQVEIVDLRRALSDLADELQRTEGERNRIAAEKSDVARTVAALEAELQRVRRDAESLGRDLNFLRTEKTKLENKQKEELSNAERTKKQDQIQTRLLNERLERQQQKALQALEDELRRTETEKNRIAAEKSDVVRTVAALEAELQRARGDADSLGRDLKHLRTEKDKLVTKQKEELSNAERTKEDQIQMRLLHGRLEVQQQTALQALEDELRRMEAEKNRTAAEKSDVIRTVAALEAELQRARGDAESLSRDLKHLRTEKDKLVTKQKEDLSNAERTKKEDQIQMRLLHERLEGQQQTALQALQELKNQVCERELRLDERVEIDDLRRALFDRTNELQRAEAEKNRIAADKSDVAKIVAALEADLQRVRRDAESLGQDLKLLRAEKSKLETRQKEEISNAERMKKQDQTQMRLLNELLDGQQQKAAQAMEALKNHVCVMDQHQGSAMKVQHNKECKGLMVQIRYLKAKFTREASLRCDLGYQKRYLLILLSRFEKTERTVLASIARIGFPAVLPVPTKTRSLKFTVLAVIFILRAKHASEVWRAQSASKEDIAAALQEVRSRRVAVTS